MERNVKYILGATLAEIEKLKELLVPYWKALPVLLKSYLKNCVSPVLRSLIATLSKAIVDEPMNSTSEGGFIAPGFSEELDELRRLQTQSVQVINELQAKYRRLVGLNSLRIRKNGIIGYYIEVPAVNKPQVQKASKEFQLYQSTISVGIDFTCISLLFNSSI